jgi:hypothetical protein
MKTVSACVWIAVALVTTAAAGDLRVTVYNSNIGVVKDTRSTRVQQGLNDISMDEIASRIDPTSVRLKIGGLGRIDVLEQNFEYDLISPDKLLQKYLKERVDITTEDAKQYAGRLLGFDSKSVVLEPDEGGVAIVSREKITDIVLPPGYKGLIVKPTLFWKVNATRSTSAEMEVAYITEGINWHAEYVAVLGERDDTIGIASWVSIDNRSGATYPEATLKLVAGEIHRVAKGIPPLMAEDFARTAAPAPRLEEKAFFEYHMYTLDGVTTVKDREVKQIQLFPEAQVLAEKEYSFDATKGEGVRVVMRFENSEDAGLGIPLPSGKVRVFKADTDGSLEFLGEDSIDHTPNNEEVKLYIGDAFDIIAERARTDFQRVSDKVTQETFEIKIANHKPEAVSVIVTEHVYGDWDVRSQSHPYRKIRADVIEFDIPVEADGEGILTYTVRRRF